MALKQGEGRAGRGRDQANRKLLRSNEVRSYDMRVIYLFYKQVEVRCLGGCWVLLRNNNSRASCGP